MPTELMTSEQLQFAHFQKSSVTAWGFDGWTHDQRTQNIFWQKKDNAAAKRDKPTPFSGWFNPNSKASYMVHEMGVSLSRVQVNQKLLCLRRSIMKEGIKRVEQIQFEGHNVPGESQAEATNRLQGHMKVRLNRCLELETLTRDGHNRPMLSCGRILLDIDPLANVVRPTAADLVDHAARGAALLVRCTGIEVPLWSPVIMNGA